MEVTLVIVVGLVALGAMALAYLALRESRKDLSKEYVDAMGKYAQNMTWLALDCYDRGYTRRDDIYVAQSFANRAGQDNLKDLSVAEQMQDYIAGRDVEPPREPMIPGEVDVTQGRSAFDGQPV